jgi:hypothetical protein
VSTPRSGPQQSAGPDAANTQTPNPDHRDHPDHELRQDDPLARCTSGVHVNRREPRNIRTSHGEVGMPSGLPRQEAVTR